MKKVIFLLIILLPLKVYSQCRSFDGIDNTVEIDNESNFDFIDVDAKFTISCWIYPVADTGYIIHKGLAIPDYTGWLLQMTDIGGYRFRLYMYDGTTELKPYPDFIVILNRWYHFAVVYDGSNNHTGATFYINGIEYASAGSGSGLNSVTTNNPVYFGSAQGGAPFFSGRLDELRIWSGEKTQALIESGMNKVVADEEDGLIGYWGFDEETGGIFDSTENNNHSVSITGTLSVDNALVRRIIGE